MSNTSDNRKADPNAEGETPPPVIQGDPTLHREQDHPLDEEEQLDEALDETFPASDPISPSRIDGPGN